MRHHKICIFNEKKISSGYNSKIYIYIERTKNAKIDKGKEQISQWIGNSNDQ